MPLVLILALPAVGLAARLPSRHYDAASTTLSGGASCMLNQVAFCDTFSTASPGGRGGDLDETKWSFSRVSKRTNPGQGMADDLLPTDAMQCRTMVGGVLPDNDSFFCNANGMEMMHWMEALNDGGDDLGYIQDAARIRQPFDIAGRTGKIVFDVDAKTAGGATWWVETWITDQPIPAPHSPTKENPVTPRNGIGLLFDDDCNAPVSQASLGEIFVFRNYAMQELPVNKVDCMATQMDGFNHIEIRMSQSHLEVWASDFSSDHGMTFPNFRQIATADNLNLPFTRGYVTVEHAQENAAKFGFPSSQTYHWHNIGFDGPVLPMDRGYDVPDALTPDGKGGLNLGYILPSDGSSGMKTEDGKVIAPFALNGVDLTNATAAFIDLDAWFIPYNGYPHPTLRYRLNGGVWRSFAYPFPDDLSTWRAVSIPAPLSDLHVGTNTLELSSVDADPGFPIVIANVDLTLQASGRASPTPTGTAGASPTATSTPMATATSTPTATATATGTAVATATSTPTATPRAGGQVGVLQYISPPGVSVDFNSPPGGNYGFQTIVVDPKAPSTVYVGTCYQGIWKSTNGGATWAKADTGSNAEAIDAGRNWTLAIDPVNSQTLYTTSGAGSTGGGIWKSTDGGVDWTDTLPQTLKQSLSNDVYDIAVDPANHDHVLVTFHEPWAFGNNPAYGSNSGVLETYDAGGTWTIHAPVDGWGSGHYIFFLDNSTTWLLGTQGDGFWRTSDAGGHWTQVTTTDMQHGASALYRSRTGALYLGALHTLLRSTDDGLSWQPVGPSTPDGYNAVIGDGTRLYAQPANTGGNTTGPQPYYSSAETDGLTWQPYNAQTFNDGPMSMAFDPIGHILYSSNWDAGVWKLQTGSAGSATATPTATAAASPTASATATPTATPGSTGTRVLGYATAGAQTDSNDGNNINGSRFTTGASGGTVTSMSVHVGAVDAAPNNQFQVAIYADNAGSPGALLATSGSATLTPNAWNSVPISAVLAPNTAYWLVYNTNTGNVGLNDVNFDPSSTPQAWSPSPVAFGTWPSSFSNATLGTQAFSIYATYR